MNEHMNYDFHTPDAIIDDSEKNYNQDAEQLQYAEEEGELEELLQYAFSSGNETLVKAAQELSDLIQSIQAKDEDHKSRLLHIETIIMMAKYQLVYIKMENSWKKMERMFSRHKHTDKAILFSKLAQNLKGSKPQKRSVCLTKASSAFTTIISVFKTAVAKRQSAGLERMRTYALASRASDGVAREQQDLVHQCQDAERMLARHKQDQSSAFSQPTSKETSQKIGHLFSRKGTTKSSAGLASAGQFPTVREDSFSKKESQVSTSYMNGFPASASQRSGIKSKTGPQDGQLAKVLSTLNNQFLSASSATKSLESRLRATENKIFTFIRDLTIQINAVNPGVGVSGAVLPSAGTDQFAKGPIGVVDLGLSSAKLFGLSSGAPQSSRDHQKRKAENPPAQTSSQTMQNWMPPQTQRTGMTNAVGSTARDGAAHSSSSAIGTTLSFHKISPHATMTMSNTGTKAKRYLEMLGNTVKDVHAPSGVSKPSMVGNSIVKSGSGLGLSKHLFEAKHSAHAIYAAAKAPLMNEGLGMGFVAASTASAKKLPKQNNKTGHI